MPLGRDNAIVTWIFDSPDGSPRELRARRGHVGTVTHMEFYGKNSGAIVLIERGDTFATHATRYLWHFTIPLPTFRFGVVE